MSFRIRCTIQCRTRRTYIQVLLVKLVKYFYVTILSNVLLRLCVCYNVSLLYVSYDLVQLSDATLIIIFMCFLLLGYSTIGFCCYCKNVQCWLFSHCCWYPTKISIYSNKQCILVSFYRQRNRCFYSFLESFRPTHWLHHLLPMSNIVPIRNYAIKATRRLHLWKYNFYRCSFISRYVLDFNGLVLLLFKWLIANFYNG
jgi:hypothetical protein